VAQNMRCVRFSLNEGQFRLATALCFVSRYCTPSELSFGKDDFAVSAPGFLEPGLQSNYCLLWSAVCIAPCAPCQCNVHAHRFPALHPRGAGRLSPKAQASLNSIRRKV
jgi:hypothetical protein